MDLAFDRDHPEILPARPGEWIYYREGVIRFIGVYDFSWTDRREPAREPDGSTSWDGIDTFIRNGHEYTLVGDFGEMKLGADDIDVVFTGPA